MIEPNIEDRMARIASGSVGGNPIDPDVSSILNRPATESMPAMTQTVEPSGTDPDVSDIVGRSNPIPLMSSLMSARQVDPAQAARAQTLGQQLGIGQDIALRNMGSVADRAFMAEINRRDIAVANPVVARLLSQRDFANIAHDDIPNLVDADEFWKSVPLTNNVLVDWLLPIEWKKQFAGGVAKELGNPERQDLVRDIVWQRDISSDERKARAKRFNELRAQEAMFEPMSSGWIATPVSFITQQLVDIPRTLDYVVTGATVGAGIGAVGGMGALDWATIPMGALGGGAVGLTTGFGMNSFYSNAAEIYFDLTNKGYDHETARAAAQIGGGLIAAVDIGTLKLASGFTRGVVKKALGNAMLTNVLERFGLQATEAAAERAAATLATQAVTAPAKVTMLRGLAKAGLEGLKATSVEAGGEAFQDVIQYATEVAANQITPAEMRKALQSPESLADAAKGWANTFYETMRGAWVFEIPGMAGHVRHTYKQVQAVERFTALTNRVASLSQSSALRERSPDTYAGAVDTMAQGSGAETIYIDGMTARNVLAQANVSDEQVEQIMPGLSAQIRDAAESGTDVTIPMGQFAARVANTPVDQALRQHMRGNPSESTAAEMQFANRMVTAMVQEKEQELSEQISRTKEFIKSANEVQDTVYSDLFATGRYTAEQARTQAAFAKRFYATMAARQNQMPGELYAKLPYRTVMEGQAIPSPSQPSPTPAVPQAEATVPATQFADVSTATADASAQVDAAVAAGELNEQQASQARNSVKKLNRASVGGKIAELAQAAWQAAKRNIGAIKNAVDKANSALAALGVEVVDPVGSKYVEGIQEYEVVSFEPYQEGQANEAPHVSRTIAPIVRRNGQIIAKGQVVVREGSPQYIAQQEQLEESKKAEMRARLGGAAQPLEQAAIPFAQAPVSPGFYSALAKAVDAVDAKSMAASGWKERIKGLVNKGDVKQDEVDWSGLTDWLDMQEGKVTKEAVAEFLKNNGVRVERVQIGGTELENLRNEHARAEMDYDDAFEAERAAQLGTDEAAWNAADARLSEARRRVSVLSARLAETERASTKFSQYTLPGGTNYREVLITLPSVITSRAAEQARYNELVAAGFPLMEAQRIASETAADIQDRQLELQKQQEPYASNVAELVRLVSGNVEGSSPFTMFQWLKDHPNKAEWQPQIDAWIDAVGGDFLAYVENRGWLNDLEAFQNLNLQIEALRAERRIREREQRGFKSSHWDQPNVLVHFRLNDRVDADGKRVLFVEEIQSDWGQAGRKKGFASPMLSTLPAGTKLYEPGTSPYDAKMAVVELPAGIGGRSLFYGNTIEEAKANALAFTKPGAVPLAPFVENTDGWLNLGLKHIMLEATQGNYDRVAFVNGKQSADRYELSKQVSLLSVNKQADGRYLTYIEGIDGSPLIRNRDGFSDSGQKVMTAEELADTVGKDVAEQAINGKPNKDGWVDVRGDDLKVGGKGMIEFYDKIVPTAVNKLLKKYGGGKLGNVMLSNMREQELAQDAERMGMTQADVLDLAEPGEYAAAQPGFLVTPEMVKKLESGLPLFQAMPAPGAPRGGFDPARLTTLLTKRSDLTTWLHETAHFFFVGLSQMASQADALPGIRADMDAVLTWFKIEGATPEERLANWNALTMEQQRKYHEQWAYNFEQYLADGKAPSIELQGVFDRFAAWIRGVYKTVRDELNAIYRREFGEDLPILTGEVRSVMDRMLASEEQIKLAREVQSAKPLFAGRPEGMSDAEWAAYQAMAEEDENEAIAAMTKASIGSMEWLSGARSRMLAKLQSKHDKVRGEIRKRLQAEVEREPAYRALRYFRTGVLVNEDGTEVKTESGYKLRTTGIEQVLNTVNRMIPVPGTSEMRFAEGYIDPLKVPKSIMAADGMDPSVAAEMLGFASAEEMLRGVVNAKPIREEVNARADAEMARDYSELATPEGRERQIQKALHTEMRERMIGVELRWLAKATQPVRVFVEAARQAAEQIIGGVLVKNLSVADYTAAEARAARDASMSLESLQSPAQARQRAYTAEYNKAIAEGEPEATAVTRANGAGTIAEVKAQQRIDQFKAKYGDATPEQITLRATRQRLLNNQLAKAALSVRDEIQTSVKYLRKVMRDTNVKRMGAEAADQIASLLERFDVRPLTKAEANRRAVLAKWVEDQESKGIEPDLDPELLKESYRISYKNMTITQFRDLVAAIEQIEHIGKHANKLLSQQRKAEFQAVLETINTRVRQSAKEQGRTNLARNPNTPSKAVFKQIRKFHISHLTASSIIRILDGGKDGGPIAQMLLLPMNKAGDLKTQMTADATVKLTEILKPFLSSGAMTGQMMTFPGINRPLTLEERMVIALNVGNAGNLQRLLDGEGWTMDTIRPVLESLTSEQWNAVQQVWDYLDTFRPLFAERSRRMIGREPQWVEAVPFQVRTSDGKDLSLRGGYYPAKYDTEASIQSERLDAATQAEQQMNSARMVPSTRNSGLLKRAKQVKNRPILLNLSALYSRVDEMIHDYAYREVIIDANRLLNSSFDDTMRETFGAEWVRKLREWVSDVAAGDSGPMDATDQVLNFVRRGKTASVMGLNLFNTVQNLTGMANSWERIGGKWLASGIQQFASRPLEQIKRVYAMSSFMRNRARTSMMTLNEVRNVVQGESRTMRQVEIAAYYLTLQSQRVVDMCTWLGQYSKMIAEGKTEEQAIALSDQAVIDAQGSGMTKDLAAVMRGSGKKKILTMFYSFFNSTYNMISVKQMTSRDAADIAATYFRVIVVPATLSYMLKQLLKPSVDDEEKDLTEIARELAGENLSYLMNTVIGVRELAPLAQSVFDSDNRPLTYGGPAVFGGIGDGYRFLNQVRQGELDAGFRRAFLSILGWGTGLPTAQLNRTLDGLTAIYEGKTVSPLAPVFGTRR